MAVNRAAMASGDVGVGLGLRHFDGLVDNDADAGKYTHVWHLAFPEVWWPEYLRIGHERASTTAMERNLPRAPRGCAPNFFVTARPTRLKAGLPQLSAPPNGWMHFWSRSCPLEERHSSSSTST